MLLSKFLFTILVTIVSKTIFKPCGSVHNVKQLNEVKYSFLQSDNKDGNTPDTVNTGETVDVASNKVDTTNNSNQQSGSVDSKTTDAEVHKHQDGTVEAHQPVVTTGVKKDEHRAQEQNQKVEEKKDEGHVSVDNKAKDEEHNQEKSTNEEKEKNGTNEVEQHKEGEKENKDKQEEHENEEHKGVNENKNDGGSDHSEGSVENGHSTEEHTVQATVTPHQPSESHNEVENKKEEDVNQHKQEGEQDEHNKEGGENDKSAVEEHEENSSNKQEGEQDEEHEDHKSNKDGEHEHQGEDGQEHEEEGEEEHEEHEEGEQHKAEGPVTAGGSQDLHGEGEENEEKAEHGDQETASAVKNGQQPVTPPVSVAQPSLQNNQTAQSDVNPHQQTPPTTEQPQATSVSAQVQNNGSGGSANSTPDAYKVDLNSLTDDQKKAVRSFYEKPSEFCSVDCSHSCKSELGGSTQCVSQTGSSVSCSTFDDPNSLTCPSGYTPCAQPNVTTLKSFTLKKGDQEVGALEVDGSNFNSCMGLMLAPSDGVCDREHLVHNLLFTSDKVNVNYQTQVASDKLTFSNLTIKDGEYKVCLFMRYQPKGDVGVLSDWYKKIVDFFNPTHQQSQPLRTVFVLEVGSLKVSD